MMLQKFNPTWIRVSSKNYTIGSFQQIFFKDTLTMSPSSLYKLGSKVGSLFFNHYLSNTSLQQISSLQLWHKSWSATLLKFEVSKYSNLRASIGQNLHYLGSNFFLSQVPCTNIYSAPKIEVVLPLVWNKMITTGIQHVSK